MFTGDPHILIGDPIFLLEAPRFSLEAQVFFLRPHIFVRNPNIYIGVAQNHYWKPPDFIENHGGLQWKTGDVHGGIQRDFHGCFLRKSGYPPMKIWVFQWKSGSLQWNEIMGSPTKIWVSNEICEALMKIWVSPMKIWGLQRKSGVSNENLVSIMKIWGL